ncbi:MAG: hypothetical protein DI551_07575 [Micavibrio aeruginosavorus]|uniref:Cupin type-2 domain-containing protein n=1 Tax=Micavibrio aeruginosavorus TaxID=349221 RepID=A0A2W5MVX2_9BACT|nr:MAG: hypothetical protein DI551_07575 [Micavibrio aeruginosavorus]
MKIETFMFESDKDIPNNPDLPVLVCWNAATSSRMAKYFESCFDQNGWAGIWTDTVYDYTHFHPNAHEVIGVSMGKGRIQIGGEKGRAFDLNAGDMLILPAGTGHRRIGQSPEFQAVGAYPWGQENYETARNAADMAGTLARIKEVELPRRDPLFGFDGPLLDHWK